MGGIISLFLWMEIGKKIKEGITVMMNVAGSNPQTFYAFTSVVNSIEGEENFVGDSEIIALGGASNETKDRPLG